MKLLSILTLLLAGCAVRQPASKPLTGPPPAPLAPERRLARAAVAVVPLVGTNVVGRIEGNPSASFELVINGTNSIVIGRVLWTNVPPGLVVVSVSHGLPAWASLGALDLTFTGDVELIDYTVEPETYYNLKPIP